MSVHLKMERDRLAQKAFVADRVRQRALVRKALHLEIGAHAKCKQCRGTLKVHELVHDGFLPGDGQFQWKWRVRKCDFNFPVPPCPDCRGGIVYGTGYSADHKHKCMRCFGYDLLMPALTRLDVECAEIFESLLLAVNVLTSFGDKKGPLTGKEFTS